MPLLPNTGDEVFVPLIQKATEAVKKVYNPKAVVLVAGPDCLSVQFFRLLADSFRFTNANSPLKAHAFSFAGSALQSKRRATHLVNYAFRFKVSLALFAVFWTGKNLLLSSKRLSFYPTDN